MARGSLRSLVVVLALFASACGSSTTSEVAVAADGAVPTVAGGQVEVNSLEGQDTVLWFWAPW